jgi:hypothetical protein
MKASSGQWHHKERTMRPMADLLCPLCEKDIEAPGLLSGVVAAYGTQRFFATTCPRCHGSVHLRLSKGRLILGFLDGAPGPVFMEEGSIRVPGLSVHWGRGHATLSWPGGRCKVPVKG